MIMNNIKNIIGLIRPFYSIFLSFKGKVKQNHLMEATKKDYLENRLDNQIEWYSSKSSKYKCYFLIMRTTEIIIAAIIPVLFYYPTVKSCIPLLSVIIVVLVVLMSLFKIHENWILYRTISESLKHEKYLYLTKTEPYRGSENFSILVNNVEQIVSSRL